MPYLIQLTIDKEQVSSVVHFLKMEKGIKNVTVVDSNTTTNKDLIDHIHGSNTPLASSTGDDGSKLGEKVMIGSVHVDQDTFNNHNDDDTIHLYDTSKNNGPSDKSSSVLPGTPTYDTMSSSSPYHKVSHNCCLVLFRCRDERLTEIVTDLSEVKGVGLDYGMIDVMNLIATKPHLTGEPTDNKTAKRTSKFAKRRLLTEYVYAQVLNQSKLTLDFLLFCLIGAILAGVGLATDNAVTIVASMLVSPLMGPILGLTLGTIIRSRVLIVKSIKSELAGCLLALCTGMVIGAVLSPFGGPHSLGFPTFQMLDRGRLEGIIFGIVIAFVSGIGVALAVSHGSINSLVGVAISAALLPPITNTGMLFSYALFSLFMPQVNLYTEVRNKESYTYTTGDYFAISGISFCIFVLNFVLIYSTGLVIFKLKEFAPMKQKSQMWSDFKSIDAEKPIPFSFETSLNPAASILDSITQRKAGAPNCSTASTLVTLRSTPDADTAYTKGMLDDDFKHRTHIPSAAEVPS